MKGILDIPKQDALLMTDCVSFTLYASAKYSTLLQVGNMALEGVRREHRSNHVC